MTHRDCACLPLAVVIAALLCACASNASAKDTTGSGPPVLPAPSSLNRSASALPSQRLASQHIPGLAQRVSVSTGFSASFTPDFTGAAQRDGLAWAVYELSAAGQAGTPVLHVTWSGSSPGTGTAWLALGDLTRNCWDWRQLDGSDVELDPARDVAPDGRVLVALAVTGQSPCTLSLLRIGDPLPSPHDTITAGCTLVGGGNYGSRSSADSPLFEPLLWAGPHATGGDKLGLQGTLPVAGWAGYHGSGRVLFWSMHEALWGSGKDGLDSNDLFRRQAFAWLLDGRTRVGVSTAHSASMDSASLSADLRGWMDSQGVSYIDEGNPVDAAVLSNYDLLFICYPDPWPQAELDALAAWVADGGSVLMCSQGWSWNYGNGDHPLEVLGAPFGLHIYGGTVSDPDAPNAQSDTPNFAVQPLSAYTPARVIVLKKGVDDLDSVKTRAAAQPGDIFVLEGDHFGLQVLTADWPRLNDPSAAIDVLDAMYLNHLALTGGAPPFGGDIVWAISVYDPAGAYWMHSGNPIVMKQEAGSDVVDTFNAYGVAGWGLPHELGHDMHSSACGNMFIPYGLAEPSANIWSVWTFRQLGWDWAAGGHADYADAGVAYHNQLAPDIAQLKADAWIMLGCWDLIWQRYGWGGMQSFLTETAQDVAGGASAGDDDARVAYMVEGVSRNYQIDFSPLFLHWGFPVSAATQIYTDQWPDSDIPIP